MTVIIYASIASEGEMNFHPEIIQFIQSENMAKSIFDFDSRSERLMLDYAERILEESEDVFIILDAQSEGELGLLIPFCNKLRKYKSAVKGVLIGENAILEKMIGLFGKAFQKVTNTQEAKQWLGKGNNVE